MAAPTFKDYGNIAEETSGDSSVSIDYVSPVAANDLLILYVFNNDLGNVVTPSGWTAIGNKISFDGSCRLYSFKKKASGSETGTVTVSRIKQSGSGVLAGQMFSFDGTDFIDVLGYATDSDDETTIDIPTISISGTERTLISFILNGALPDSHTGSYTEQSVGSFDSGDFYFQALTKANVSSAPAQTAGNGSVVWITFHTAIYNNDPVLTSPRSFIVN